MKTQSGLDVHIDFREDDSLGLIHGIIFLSPSKIKRTIWYSNGKYVGIDRGAGFSLEKVPDLNDIMIGKIENIGTTVEEKVLA